VLGGKRVVKMEHSLSEHTFMALTSSNLGTVKRNFAVSC